jgi:hypothetical protein
MQVYSSFDPKEKIEDDETLREQMNEEGVVLVNNDGTPFDNSERTYVSVDLPEEKSDAASNEDR